MTMPLGDIRVRRPQHHETLLQELKGEAFPTFRDALLFAAAVGAHFGRRVPFSGSGEPVRYETLKEPMFAETVVNMIATNSEEGRDNPEILDSARLAERLRIFEEYVSGGLEYIQEQVNVRHQPANLVVISLVSEALEGKSGAEPATVEELLGSISW